LAEVRRIARSRYNDSYNPKATFRLMTREKLIALLLAALIVLPVVYDFATAPEMKADAVLDQMAENRELMTRGDSGWSQYIAPGIYWLVIVVAGMYLLSLTESVASNRKWLWGVFLVTLAPVTSLALIYRVYHGKQFSVPRTVDEQRQILRDNVARIKSEQGSEK
jgi:hypothetical protein